MLMIGLGEAGKNIAKLFKPHSKNYKVILIDGGEGIETKNTVEEYDSVDFKLKQKGLKSHSEAILFVCGSGKVAGATLRILEALKGFKTTVVYIKPDVEFASRLEKKRHKVHFGILQQYARTGSIHEMILVDNKILLNQAGAGKVTNYYEKVNYFIYSILQNLMYCAHVDPDYGRIHEKKSISRICTIGFGGFYEDDENFIFPLDNITETCYYINIEESDLENDTNIIPRCQEIVRENKTKDRETSFAIWKSSENNHYYSKHYTHFIQEE
tara:strand:- start:618 stop:1427 length:810 start_codon:yes stop_codon:yes gene_type:complete